MLLVAAQALSRVHQSSGPASELSAYTRPPTTLPASALPSALSFSYQVRGAVVKARGNCRQEETLLPRARSRAGFVWCCQQRHESCCKVLTCGVRCAISTGWVHQQLHTEPMPTAAPPLCPYPCMQRTAQPVPRLADPAPLASELPNFSSSMTII